MLNDDTYLEIEPSAEQRQAFAKWGVRQDPKVRTVGISTFAVPYHLLTDIPEAVLVGALIDGHLYRHVEEEPLEAAPVEPFADDVQDESWPCDDCERVFTTERGLNLHRSHKHPEGVSA